MIQIRQRELKIQSITVFGPRLSVDALPCLYRGPPNAAPHTINFSRRIFCMRTTEIPLVK